MPCYHPVQAFRLSNGEIVFVERGDVVQTLDLPCGRCIGCRLERSRKWATRCVHESQMHERSSYVTLTYDDAHLPQDGGLHHRDFQLFMKRVRKEFGPGIRYYMCGEYGDVTARPHYHALLFGVGFDDLEPWKKNPRGDVVYRSATLERLWRLGFCLVGEVTFESAAYVARYVMKKVTGDAAEEEYRRVDPDSGEVFQVVPPYNRMSLKPGIGSTWLAKFGSDVYPQDHCVVNGVPGKPPRYYDQHFEKLDPEGFEDLKFRRLLKGRKANLDNSNDRLAVKERVAEARIKSLKREL